MRPSLLLGLVSILLASVAGATPHAAAPMDYDQARHLLARTGFGPTDEEVRAFTGLTRDQGVARLLRDTRTAATVPAPDWTHDGLRPLRAANLGPDEIRAYLARQRRETAELRAWWVQEMLATPSPLTERMTLFWHNHFVSSAQKVRSAKLLYAQNATLRANALGSFATLLHSASKDPAMLVYLDVAQSRRGQPNENFAREVMELFTLGEGHYTERDVKEAARAFTGWSIDRETGLYVFRPILHDFGSKTVLGRMGYFEGDAVLDAILAQPQAARFVVAKLWREFVSPDPDPREVQRIADDCRAHDYSIKAALRGLLLCDAFWDARNRGSLVKSPVEVVVGTLRQLDLVPDTTLPFAAAASGMGQVLFAPPNVKGWPGGETWINSNTLLARKQYLDLVARGDSDRPVGVRLTRREGATTRATTAREIEVMTRPRADDLAATNGNQDAARARRFGMAMIRSLIALDFDAAQWLAQRPGATAEARMQWAQALLLPLAPLAADAPAPYLAADDSDAVAFVHATLLDPAYQLK
jgi:uncharacterized protein (DUF1800 family)